MLTIRAEQQRALALEEFRRRAVNFLRLQMVSLDRVAFSDSDFSEAVQSALETGPSIGVKTERELVKWALIGLITKGKAHRDESVLSIIRNGGEHSAKVHQFLGLLNAEIYKQR